MSGVLTTARQLLDYPELDRLNLKVDSFRRGRAPVPPELPRRAVEVFGSLLQVINGYGLGTR